MSRGKLFQGAQSPSASDGDGDVLHKILYSLGQLQTGVENLRSDFKDEKQSAALSRASVHARLDEQVRDLSEIKLDFTALKGDVEDVVRWQKSDGKPTVEEWKRMKLLGTGVVGLVAISGLSLGATLAWFSDWAIGTVRHWLRIG